MTSPAALTETPPDPSTFSLKPLMFETFVCTMAMMAFVSLIGPIGRVVGLAAWQVGTAVTVAGVAWMFFGRIWGAASDRYGRRFIILSGLAGFAISYAVMCLFIELSVNGIFTVGAAFAGLVVLRGLAGAFYAAVPTTATAFVADHVIPEKRAGAMAMIGASGGAGMVFGPALAGNLASYDIVLPLYVIAVLPVIAFTVLWRVLPRKEIAAETEKPPVKLFDPRLRKPMSIAFISMFSIAVAQITVGFYAIDRFALDPQEGARVAGMALTCVGVALIVSQSLVRFLGWAPMRFIRIGSIIAAIGFGAASFANTPMLLWLCYFVAAAGMGWVWPSISALAANSVEVHEQGAAAGTITAAQGLGTILGPLAGTLIYGINISGPYMCVALLLFFMALLPAGRAARSS